MHVDGVHTLQRTTYGNGSMYTHLRCVLKDRRSSQGLIDLDVAPDANMMTGHTLKWMVKCKSTEDRMSQFTE